MSKRTHDRTKEKNVGAFPAEEILNCRSWVNWSYFESNCTYRTLMPCKVTQTCIEKYI